MGPTGIVYQVPLHSARGDVRVGGVIRKGFLEGVDLRGSGWRGCRGEGMPGERYSLVKPGVGRQAGQWERLHVEVPGKVRLGAE